MVRRKIDNLFVDDGLLSDCEGFDFSQFVAFFGIQCKNVAAKAFLATFYCDLPQQLMKNKSVLLHF